jgi:hypothetical protein
MEESPDYFPEAINPKYKPDPAVVRAPRVSRGLWVEYILRSGLLSPSFLLTFSCPLLFVSSPHLFRSYPVTELDDLKFTDTIDLNITYTLACPAFPPSMFSSLTSLHVSGAMSSLSYTVGQLENLTELDISSNYLRTVCGRDRRR